jgi:integrase
MAMAREIDRLTVAQVARLQSEPGMHPDGRGLYLNVKQTAAGALSSTWIFRFRSPIDGRTRDMGLGSAQDFTLQMARKRAEAARRLLADGIDPIAHRGVQRRAAVEAARTARGITFEQVARNWHEANQAEFSNEKYKRQWIKSLERYAFPKIGKVSVSEIDEHHVLGVLKPVWQSKTRTAERVRQRIEKVLTSATALKHQEGPNPARWDGHLDHVLPSVGKIAPVENHAALPYREIPGFMKRLRSTDGVPARALEFTVLTVARTGSVRQARWSEFDLDAALWVCPVMHMKTRREHIVPLCPRAVEILRQLPREGDYVFIGERKGKSIGNMVMPNLLEDLLKELKLDHATVHGMRASFKTWCLDATEFADELSEIALSHKVGDDTRNAYARTAMIKRRRPLMDAWSRYCGTPPRPAATVTPLPRIAAGA